MLRLAAAVALALSLGGGAAAAREFWIAPDAFRTPSDAPLRADLRIGDGFDGFAPSFEAADFVRFEIVTAEDSVPVEASGGDGPAVSAADLPEGLALIVHETATREGGWTDWREFMAFVEEKGLGDLPALQDGPKREPAGLREDCIRYAKALVSIGHGRGADRLLGMRAEFLALGNPYTDDLAGVLPVQLWLDGAPRRAAQVEVFSRPSEGGEVTSEIFRTDGNGIVILPVREGTEYLLSAVTLEQADGQHGGPDWRTLRATLTFEVPAPSPLPSLAP
jgi:hypothetical protein